MKHISPEDFIIAKPDLSLRGLIAWLEAMPADGTYIHTWGDECLLGKWLKSVDPVSSYVRNAGYDYMVNGEKQSFLHLMHIANGNSTPADWTFGKALDRARVWSASHSINVRSAAHFNTDALTKTATEFHFDRAFIQRPNIKEMTVFARHFAMPNAETFSIKPIEDFVRKYLAWRRAQ